MGAGAGGCLVAAMRTKPKGCTRPINYQILQSLTNQNKPPLGLGQAIQAPLHLVHEVSHGDFTKIERHGCRASADGESNDGREAGEHEAGGVGLLTQSGLDHVLLTQPKRHEWAAYSGF